MKDLVITPEMVIAHYRKQIEGVDSILAAAEKQGNQATIDFWAPKRVLIEKRLQEAITELESEGDEE